MRKIHKLDQNVIDQIAAGEVVERPASVMKELVENSIDADSKNISIKIKSGGIEYIEVKDDGVGISKEDLMVCLDAHSTSKILEIDDIENIDSLGFRGEALSSISSVSTIHLVSKEIDSDEIQANKIVSKYGDRSDIKSSSRDFGTTIIVEKLFHNIPARRKFLKTAKTEYRKILDKFVRIALVNPQVHFTLINDEREVYNLPLIIDSQKGTIHPQRIGSLIKNVEFIPVFYDGEGITIGGYVGHPEHFAKRVSSQYIFVNGRSIWDNGIAKSVILGAHRYIPSGTKIPFIISINLPPRLIDVNVHPQKSEVRFANPYRIYSAVEKSVKAALSNLSKAEPDDRDRLFRIKEKVEKQKTDMDDSRIELFRSGKKYGVDESMEFSRVILQDSDDSKYFDGTTNNKAYPFLGKYVVTERDGDLWIIDQHAAAERIRFEKLVKEYSGKGIESQSLLVTEELNLSKADLEIIKEYRKALKWLGFDFDDKFGRITAVPGLLSSVDLNKLIKEIIEELRDVEEFDNKDQILSGDYRDSVIATMACHSSLRANKKISNQEAQRLLEDLLKCENSYSCPHGRPIVWKLNPSEIDKHFNRT